MSDDPTNIELEHVLDAARQALLRGMHVCQPGRITAYDKTKQRASVQPLVMTSHVLEDETDKVEAHGEIHDVIVVHMGPGRGRITFPVRVGDDVMLHHTSCALDAFRLKGGMVDPKNDRQFDLSDAIAVPCMHDFAHVPTDAPDDAVVIHVSAGIKILLGGSDADDPVLRKSDLAWLIAAFNSHTHLVADVPSAGPATVDVTHTIPVPEPAGSAISFTK